MNPQESELRRILSNMRQKLDRGQTLAEKNFKEDIDRLVRGEINEPAWEIGGRLYSNLTLMARSEQIASPREVTSVTQKTEKLRQIVLAFGKPFSQYPDID